MSAEFRPLKLVVLGDGACGKTCLVNQFVHDVCLKEYIQTLGVEFYSKSVCFLGGYSVSVQVWDIGGQALGGEMLDKYLYGADGIFLIYDVTNENSFDNLEDWLSVVRSSEAFVGEKSLPRIAVVGNKCDLEHLRVVKSDLQKRFAMQNDLSSYTLSARTGELVNSCFRNVIADILGMSLVCEEELMKPVEPEPVLVTDRIPSNEMPTASLLHVPATVAAAAAAYRSPVCTLQ